MRVRHEILIDDIALAADPGFSMPLFLNDSDVPVQCLVISNYDEFTEEDLPSLLIRQDVLVNIPHDTALDLNNYNFPRMQLDYDSAEHPYPATRLAPRIIWARTNKLFLKNHPYWEDYIQDLDRRLSDRALTIINAIRWRFGLWGGRDVLEDRIILAEIPLPGKPEWAIIQSSRFDLILSVWDTRAAKLNADSMGVLQSMLSKGLSEPLSRDLLREASQHRETSPRSSLIVGVAAAEVGMKKFLTLFLPSWSQSLVLDSPQMPIHKLMANVLPDLINTRWNFPSPELPKETVRKRIQEAAELRNVAVHQPPDSPGAVKLESYFSNRGHVRALTAISDLLAFLDYFSGNSWALDNLSSESRDDWFRRNPGS